MSYTGLVFDRDQAQTAAEEFLDEIILFIVHRRAAETRHRRHVIENCAVTLVDKIRVASFFHPLRDSIHRPIERPLFPLRRIRSAIKHLRDAMRIDGQLKRVGAFGTERAFVDGTFRIAFDVDDPAAFDMNQLAAADRAIWADTGHRNGVANSRSFLY